MLFCKLKQNKTKYEQRYPACIAKAAPRSQRLLKKKKTDRGVLTLYRLLVWKDLRTKIIQVIATVVHFLPELVTKTLLLVFKI